MRGLSEEQPTELLAIANAVHALLARTAAEDGPVALIVDDVAWVDRSSATVLGTLARSLCVGPITVLGASRTGDESFLSSIGITEYEVQPLDDLAANQLVSERFPAMTARVRRRLVAEARGNPLALLELPVPLNSSQRTERGHAARRAAVDRAAEGHLLHPGRRAPGRDPEAAAARRTRRFG